VSSFAEHACVRLRDGLSLSGFRWLPAGVEGYVVDVHGQGVDRTFTVEIIIENDEGVQVDGWLLDVTAAQLEPATADHAKSRIRRRQDLNACYACSQAFLVTFEQPTYLPTRVTHPVECPQCGAVNDNLAMGALAPPRVSLAER
jgi:hypothetical protein